MHVTLIGSDLLCLTVSGLVFSYACFVFVLYQTAAERCAAVDCWEPKQHCCLWQHVLTIGPYMWGSGCRELHGRLPGTHCQLVGVSNSLKLHHCCCPMTAVLLSVCQEPCMSQSLCTVHCACPTTCAATRPHNACNGCNRSHTVRPCLQQVNIQRCGLCVGGGEYACLQSIYSKRWCFGMKRQTCCCYQACWRSLAGFGGCFDTHPAACSATLPEYRSLCLATVTHLNFSVANRIIQPQCVEHKVPFNTNHDAGLHWINKLSAATCTEPASNCPQPLAVNQQHPHSLLLVPYTNRHSRHHRRALNKPCHQTPNPYTSQPSARAAPQWCHAHEFINCMRARDHH